MAATTIVRTDVNLTDDSGSGTDGTVINAAWATAFMDRIDGFWTGSQQIEAGAGTLGLTINNTQADGDGVLVFQNAGTAVWSLGFDDGDSDKFKIGTTAIGTNTRLAIDSSGNVLIPSGSLLIGDTANANMTLGLTINQGAADNQAFCIKSSDISTGITTVPTSGADVEVDDYFTLGKRSGPEGGVAMLTLVETSSYVAFVHEAWGGAPATTQATSSTGTLNWRAGQHDGSNADVNMAANSNAFTWAEIDGGGASITRMLLKADDGELWLGDTTLEAFDGEDDIALVRAMQFESSGGRGMAPTPWNTADYGVPAFSHEKLMAVGVLGEKDAEGNCLMCVQPRFAMNEGAIWQLHCRQVQSDDRVAALESRLRLLEA